MSPDPSPRLPLALGLLACGAGMALLVVAFLMPPRTICDPLLGIPVLAFVAAQAAGCLGLAGIARAVGSKAPILVGCAAWAAASAAALGSWTAAGHLDVLAGAQAAQAIVAGLALALLLAGLAFKAREGGARALALPALVAMLAGLGAAYLARGAAADRMILSWARLDAVAFALGLVDPAELPPGDDVALAEVAAALPPEARLAMDVTDAWGRPLRYARIEPRDAQSPPSWRAWSQGADGETDPRRPGPVRRFDGDLAISGEGPVAWPERPCGEEPAALAPEPVDLRGETAPR